MHNFLQKILFVIACLSVDYVSAQVLPPDFVCVKSDTLIWNPVSNPCGDFVSYDIYFASMEQGPYALLASIIDPAENKFFHSNPSDLTWYYYLESNHNCPGQTFFKSDTLDNRSPEVPSITNLSVVGNNVEIIWEESTSPETIGYIIYRETNAGTVPIDTIFTDVAYIDSEADPMNQTETYYVLALDPCGNTSLFGDPQRTYMLNSEVIECLQEINISWIPTTNWPSGIATQEVWISEDGATPILHGSLAGEISNYTIPEVKEGTEYCIYVKAISNGDGFEVTTNTVCLTPSVIEPITSLYFKNVDIQLNDNVEIEWIWNADAALKLANLNYSQLGGSVANNLQINITPPLQNRNILEVTETKGNDGQWEFNIETTDECDSIRKSNFASPIFLSIGSSGGLSNTCFWSPLKIPNADIKEYEVIRTINGRSTTVATVDNSTLDYTDNLNINDVTEGQICYTVRATSMLTHPDGTEETIKSNSNQICKSLSAQIFMPNAFAPRGRNQILKPVISFGVPVEFKMLIYNRYGGLVFQTDDIENGWNGKYEGRDAPMGVYSYLINMIQQDGTSEQMNGTVMLVR